MSRKGVRVRIASKRRCQTGCAGQWDEKNQALCYVDLSAGSASRLDPETREDIDTIHLEGVISFAIPVANEVNKVIVGHNHSVKICDMKKKHEEIIAMIEASSRDTRINDARCDSIGRLWLGTMGSEKKPLVVDTERGSVYSIERKQVRKHIEAMTMSFGPAWTTDSQKMFLVDTIPTGRIYIYDFEPNVGDLSNQQTAIDFTTSTFQNMGHPYGIAVDQSDKLWVACYNGSQIIRVDPNTAQIMDKVHIPTQIVTSICFGGPRHEDIYVTTGFLGLNREQIQAQPDAGAVFKVTGLPGVKGQPTRVFTT